VAEARVEARRGGGGGGDERPRGGRGLFERSSSFISTFLSSLLSLLLLVVVALLPPRVFDLGGRQNALPVRELPVAEAAAGLFGRSRRVELPAGEACGVHRPGAGAGQEEFLLVLAASSSAVAAAAASVAEADPAGLSRVGWLLLVAIVGRGRRGSSGSAGVVARLRERERLNFFFEVFLRFCE
jgi:hypothetical protein